MFSLRSFVFSESRSTFIYRLDEPRNLLFLQFLTKGVFWLYQADLIYVSQLRWLYQLAWTL